MDSSSHLTLVPDFNSWIKPPGPAFAVSILYIGVIYGDDGKYDGNYGLTIFGVIYGDDGKCDGNYYLGLRA